MDVSPPVKIVLISSGQPSLNPRLVKEADTLTNAGYEVTVLYAYWNDWGTGFDEELISNKKWKAICVGGDPQKKRITYFISRIINKLAKAAAKYTNNATITNWATARATLFLINFAKKQQARLYIAHNLGALPAAVIAANATNKLCGFDAEDFHRNETSDDGNNAEVLLKTRIEDKYLPQLDYFSASSPQTAKAYQQLYPDSKPLVLLNVFPKNSVITNRQHTKDPLKLFWFSQTISTQRGIEDVVKAMQLLNNQQFELHLLGSRLNSSPGYIERLMNSGINLTLHNPIHPDKLTQFSAQFDIGLALEPGFSINNNLALSNKLFTYMQAGLAVIASDTIAQLDFMNKNPNIGATYPKGNAEALAQILLNFHTKRNELLACQKNALQLAHDKYNWEIESIKFLDAVKKTIHQYTA